MLILAQKCSYVQKQCVRVQFRLTLDFCVHWVLIRQQQRTHGSTTTTNDAVGRSRKTARVVVSICRAGWEHVYSDLMLMKQENGSMAGPCKRKHTCKHAEVHTRNTHSHTHIHTNKYNDTRIRISTHTHTYIHTYAHAHRHSHTHTHTRTHQCVPRSALDYGTALLVYQIHFEIMKKVKVSSQCPVFRWTRGRQRICTHMLKRIMRWDLACFWFSLRNTTCYRGGWFCIWIAYAFMMRFCQSLKLQNKNICKTEASFSTRCL
jgi:hypothetical protein